MSVCIESHTYIYSRLSCLHFSGSTTLWDQDDCSTFGNWSRHIKCPDLPPNSTAPVPAVLKNHHHPPPPLPGNYYFCKEISMSLHIMDTVWAGSRLMKILVQSKHEASDSYITACTYPPLCYIIKDHTIYGIWCHTRDSVTYLF